jgi:hypothetical protein
MVSSHSSSGWAPPAADDLGVGMEQGGQRVDVALVAARA